MINNKVFKIKKRQILKKPFDHLIIDNFLKTKTLLKIQKEFPKYNDKIWHEYSNYCENKKTCNQWNYFKPTVYSLFTFLNSEKFLVFLKQLFDQVVFADQGLHGGGLNIMKNGGNLNPHLDNNIHPKTFLKRKYNLILFIGDDFKKSWGGELQLFHKNKFSNLKHGELFKSIVPKKNRVVIFDTSQDSWHAVNLINAKNKIFRRSIATYYFVSPKVIKNKRLKVLYSPTEKQKKNKTVLKFIKKRSNIKSFSNYYKV